MIDGLSSAQSTLQQQTGAKNGADAPNAPYAAFNKAKGLAQTIGTIVTEAQPVKTEGHLGRNVNIVT